MTNVSRFVRVTASIAGRGLARREFGIGLFLTLDDTLGSGAGRAGIYSDIDEVAAAFPVGSEPRLAAQAWFSQSPFPKPLVIGRWFQVDAPAIVNGARLGVLSAIQAVTDGTLVMNGEDVSGLDFSSATSFADVATTLQTTLRATSETNLDQVNVAFNAVSGGFDLTTTTDGNTATLTLATTIDPLSGTDVSSLLGLSESAGAAIKQQGVSAELVEDALDILQDLRPEWYFITLDKDMNDTQAVLDVSAWTQPREYMFSAESNSVSVLITNEAASIPAQLFALSPERTFLTWSRTADYKSVSIAARFSSVNFNGNNTLITGHLKELPGRIADDLNSTELAELDRKRLNYFITIVGSGGQSSVNAYVNAWAFRDPVFVDARYWLDWLVNAVQINVFNALQRTPTAVPQTEFGVSVITRAIEQAGDQGVRNGGAAPGTLSVPLTADVQQTTGNLDFNGFLAKGFLVYSTPIALQPQTNRDARMSPPFRMWVKSSGAIHTADIAITFEN